MPGATHVGSRRCAVGRAVRLGAGRSITVRRSRTDDLPSLRAFYDHLSDRSIYMRFFGIRPLLTDEQLHPSEGHDPRRRLVLIALADGGVVGLGEFWRIPGRDAAEVAFAVADDHHHEGIATALLHELMRQARAAGLTTLVAETLAGNSSMLDVFASLGPTTHRRYDGDQVHVEIDLTNLRPPRRSPRHAVPRVCRRVGPVDQAASTPVPVAAGGRRRPH